MKICPGCQTIHYFDDATTCFVCGKTLIFAQDHESNFDAATNLTLDFTFFTCDKCGKQNAYHQTKCIGCGDPLLDSDQSPHMPLETDPLVEVRRTAVQDLINMRTRMIYSLGQDRGVAKHPSVDDYPKLISTYLGELNEKAESLRSTLSSTDFRSGAVITDVFKSQLISIIEQYEKFYEITEEILSIEPPPTWAYLNLVIRQSIQLYFQGYLDIINAIIGDSFAHAQELLNALAGQFTQAGDKLNTAWYIVKPGKQLLFGQSGNLLESIALTSVEIESFKSFEKGGWYYFAPVFKRPVNELPSECGVQLGICAIVSESCQRSLLLRNRVGVITDLLRRANKANPTALKSAWRNIEGDIRHATRLMILEGQQYTATDFSKISLAAALNMAIHTYQRLSEGAFKNLINVLLYSERIIEGTNPIYDDISKKGFGPKVDGVRKKTKSGIQVNFRGIVDSSEPLIATLANDLEMHIRHADAHCDFDVQGERVHVHHRDHVTKNLIKTYHYTEREFIELTETLKEAVFAILIGILCFQIEFFEDFISTNFAAYSEEEKIEACKFTFALKGIVITTLTLQDDPITRKPIISLRGILVTENYLPVGLAGVICHTVTQAFPQANAIAAEFFDSASKLLGTLNVPTSHFQRTIGPSRVNQFRLIDAIFRLYSKYASPPELLGTTFSEDEIYRDQFLKPITAYLSEILGECVAYAQQTDNIQAKEIKQLDLELTTLRQILTSNPPTETYEQDFLSLIDIVQWGCAFSRSSKISLKADRRTRKNNTLQNEAVSKHAQLLKIMKQLFL